MGTWLDYILPNKKTEHSDDLQYGLQLLRQSRKATVRGVVSLAALLVLALIFAFCGRDFFWIGLALLIGNCGVWMALRWAKKPWKIPVILYQIITVEYIRSLTLSCYGNKEHFKAKPAWQRCFRGIAGGIFGFLLGMLSFPFLIPYRLWKDIGLLTLKFPEFIKYFEQAVVFQENMQLEKQVQSEKPVVYFTGECPWDFKQHEIEDSLPTQDHNI